MLLVFANLFSAAFVAFERALVATFSALEDAAEAASVELSQQTNVDN